MKSCDHHTSLQLLQNTEPALCDTERLARILPELKDARQQEPNLLFFIGRKAKEVALRELFPWNNVRKGHRDGIASLRIDNTTVDSQNPVLFAESDPFAPFMSRPTNLPARHRMKTLPLRWNCDMSGSFYDLIHARLFCLFAEVLCFFADDFENLTAVVDRLKVWTAFGKASEQLEKVNPTVIVVMKGAGPGLSPTYDLLESLDLEYSLLQEDLVELYSSIVILHLADDQMSPLARHRRLKEIIRREVTEKRHVRQSHGCLYSALHMSDLFTKAVFHTSNTIDDKFSFLHSSRGCAVETSEYLANFINLCLRHDVHSDEVIAFIASTLLLDAYPPGEHSE